MRRGVDDWMTANYQTPPQSPAALWLTAVRALDARQSRTKTCKHVTHRIKIIRTSANYMTRKAAKYGQKTFFLHFQILMEIGPSFAFS